MPPKTPKRGSASGGAKRGGRPSRGNPKAAQNQPEAVEEKMVVEEEPKVEENPAVEEKPVVEENPVVEDKAIDVNQTTSEAASEESIRVSAMKSRPFFIKIFVFDLDQLNVWNFKF